jgi:hypothetical protein
MNFQRGLNRLDDDTIQLWGAKTGNVVVSVSRGMIVMDNTLS